MHDGGGRCIAMPKRCVLYKTECEKTNPEIFILSPVFQQWLSPPETPFMAGGGASTVWRFLNRHIPHHPHAPPESVGKTASYAFSLQAGRGVNVSIPKLPPNYHNVVVVMVAVVVWWWRAKLHQLSSWVVATTVWRRDDQAYDLCGVQAGRHNVYH